MLLIIIPARNEAENLEDILKYFKNGMNKIHYEILLINDYSCSYDIQKYSKNRGTLLRGKLSGWVVPLRSQNPSTLPCESRPTSLRYQWFFAVYEIAQTRCLFSTTKMGEENIENGRGCPWRQVALYNQHLVINNLLEVLSIATTRTFAFTLRKQSYTASYTLRRKTNNKQTYWFLLGRSFIERLMEQSVPITKQTILMKGETKWK